MWAENEVSNMEGDDVHSRTAISAQQRMSPILKHLKAHINLKNKAFLKALCDCCVLFQNQV